MFIPHARTSKINSARSQNGNNAIRPSQQRPRGAPLGVDVGEVYRWECSGPRNIRRSADPAWILFRRTTCARYLASTTLSCQYVMRVAPVQHDRETLAS